MNITDVPLYPEHVAIVEEEVFLGCVDGWDVWLNPYDGYNWVNVNYGPSPNEWFNLQDDEPPRDALPEVMTYLRTLASLHQ